MRVPGIGTLEKNALAAGGPSRAGQDERRKGGLTDTLGQAIECLQKPNGATFAIFRGGCKGCRMGLVNKVVNAFALPMASRETSSSQAPVENIPTASQSSE